MWPGLRCSFVAAGRERAPSLAPAPRFGACTEQRAHAGHCTSGVGLTEAVSAGHQHGVLQSQSGHAGTGNGFVHQQPRHRDFGHCGAKRLCGGGGGRTDLCVHVRCSRCVPTSPASASPPCCGRPASRQTAPNPGRCAIPLRARGARRSLPTRTRRKASGRSGIHSPCAPLLRGFGTHRRSAIPGLWGSH